MIVRTQERSPAYQLPIHPLDTTRKHLLQPLVRHLFVRENLECILVVANSAVVSHRIEFWTISLIGSNTVKSREDLMGYR